MRARRPLSISHSSRETMIARPLQQTSSPSQTMAPVWPPTRGGPRRPAPPAISAGSTIQPSPPFVESRRQHGPSSEQRRPAPRSVLGSTTPSHRRPSPTRRSLPLDASPARETTEVPHNHRRFEGIALRVNPTRRSRVDALRKPPSILGDFLAVVGQYLGAVPSACSSFEEPVGYVTDERGRGDTSAP